MFTIAMAQQRSIATRECCLFIHPLIYPSINLSSKKTTENRYHTNLAYPDRKYTGNYHISKKTTEDRYSTM